jgi:hypothetical protein
MDEQRSGNGKRGDEEANKGFHEKTPWRIRGRFPRLERRTGA